MNEVIELGQPKNDQMNQLWILVLEFFFHYWGNELDALPVLSFPLPLSKEKMTKWAICDQKIAFLCSSNFLFVHSQFIGVPFDVGDLKVTFQGISFSNQLNSLINYWLLIYQLHLYWHSYGVIVENFCFRPLLNMLNLVLNGPLPEAKQTSLQ